MIHLNSKHVCRQRVTGVQEALELAPASAAILRIPVR
jgi:hypothetical protein